YARIEPREEHDPPVVDRREALVARVRAEPSADLTELLGSLRHLVVGDVERLRFRRDIGDIDELPVLLALVGRGFVGDNDEVPYGAPCVIGKIGYGLPEDGVGGVGPRAGEQIEFADLGTFQVRVTRFHAGTVARREVWHQWAEERIIEE